MEPLIQQLDRLHQRNVIHRDIKPENIMLLDDENGEHLVLLDFGAAREYVLNETKTITYTYTVTQADVDAGKIDNTVTATGKDPKGNDVTATDSVTVTAVAADAEVTVTKTASKVSGTEAGDVITYTVTITNSGNVTVKDIALSDTLVTLSEAAFTLAPNETKTITYTYTVTQADVDAGKIDNTVTATGKDPKGNDVTGTASVTVTTAVVVTITEHSGTAKYDGTTHKVTGYDVSISNPYYTESDFAFSGNDTVSKINAGQYNMELAETDFANTNPNFSNVKFVIVDGTLTIDPRTVTLTSADGEKVYDGQPLTKNEQSDVTVTGDGFAAGEGAVYDITGTQTDVGSSENEFTYTLIAGTLADNYIITAENGTLTVTRKAITITAEDKEKRQELFHGYSPPRVSFRAMRETDRRMGRALMTHTAMRMAASRG